MKLLQKILVVMLSVAMIFTAFPFAIFAESEPDPILLETPRYEEDIGVGADGTLTVTLSVRAIADLLGAIGTDALKEKLNALLQKEGALISLTDIMEIVPFETILAIIIGEDHRGLGRLIKNMGGVSAVREIIDEERIIASIIGGDEQDRNDFFEIIKNAVFDGDLEGIEAALDPSAVLQLNIPINYEALYEYIDFSKVKEKFQNLSAAEKQAIFTDFNGFVSAVLSGLKAGTLLDNDDQPLELGDLLDPANADSENVNAIVSALIDLNNQLFKIVAMDVIAAGLTVPAAAYDLKSVDELEAVLTDPANAAFKDSIIARIKDPDNQIITPAGKKALALLLMEGDNLTAEDQAAILNLLRAGGPNNEVYLNLDNVIAQADTFLTTAGIEKVMELTGYFPTPAEVWDVLKENPEYYNEDTLKNAITTAGRMYLLRNIPGGTAAIIELFSHQEYYDSIAFQASISQDGQARAMQLMLAGAGAQEAVAQMLQEGFDDPTLGYFDADAVIASINDQGLVYLTENIAFSPATVDESVMEGLFSNPDYYQLTDIKMAVNPMGYQALFQTYADQIPALTDEQIQTILGNGDYYDLPALYTVLENEITEAGQLALYNWLVANNKLNVGLADLQGLIANPDNYNENNLGDAVLRSLNDPGVTVELEDVVTLTDASALVDDAEIYNFLCQGKLGEYFELFEVSDIMAIVTANGGWDQFLSSGIYDYVSLIDLALSTDDSTGEYLYVDVSALVEKILNGSLSNLPDVLKAGESFATILADGRVVSIQQVMQLIINSEQMDSYVDFNIVFNLLANSENGSAIMGRLLEQVDPVVLSEELGDNISEILEAMTDEQFTGLVEASLICGSARIRRVLVDGYEIAARGRNGLLKIDFNGLVAALWSIIPKFEEMGSDNFDGTLSAFNFRVYYETAEGDEREKDINLALKVEGNLGTIRRVAKVLDRYIKLEKTNNFFQLTINVPSFVTDLYRYVLEQGDSEAIVSLRQKLLAMETLTGREFADALRELPLSEIIAGLRDFDICELYERIVATGKVEALLQKIEQYAGLHVGIENVATLDKILEQFRRDDLSTIAQLIERVSEQVGMDLMATLEKVAKVIDENEYAQRLVEKARTIPFVGKFFQNVTAQEVLEEYQNYNPIEAIVRYATQQLNRDFVSKFYSDATVSELYQRGLNYAENRLSNAYTRFCNLLGNLLDPNYVPTNERLARILSYVPDGLFAKIAEHSLLSFYRGNGTFRATKDSGALDLNDLSERLVDLVERFMTVSDDMRTYALALLPAGSFYYAAEVTVNFDELYQVDYYKKDGSKWFSTFLPETIDPKVVPLPVVDDFEAIDWMDAPDENAVKVEKITMDQSLYPFYLEYFDVTYEYEGNEIGSEVVLDGSGLAEVPDDPALPDQTHDWELRYYVGADEIDPATYIVTDDVTVTLKYVQLTDTVTWKNGDSVIYSEELAYGETPEYDTATYGVPQKTADAQYTYTFAGWTPEVVAVTGNATYTATFTSTTNKYTVTWKNGSDVIYSEQVEYGQVPSYNTATYGTPTKAADAQYTYTFAGWTPAVVAVTGNAIYTATFTATVSQYKIIYVYQNVEIGSETVQAGNGLAQIPANPALPDATHVWELRYYAGIVRINPATYIPTANTTITLVYADVTPQPTYYTVTYLYEGQQIGTEEVPANGNFAALPDAPALPDEDHVWELRYYVGADEIDPATYVVTENVTVTLEYVDVTPEETVIIMINGEEIEAPVGSVVPFEITVEPGEQITDQPEGAKLIDTIENPDGSVTYVYAVIAEPDLPPITYKVEKTKKNEYYITDGKIGEKQEGVEYDNGTEYFDGIYYMEVGRTTPNKTSWAWLVVLAVIAALIAFVAISYLLIKKFAWGPNVFTFIIIGIVSGVKYISLGLYNVVTGKVFRKKQ